MAKQHLKPISISEVSTRKFNDGARVGRSVCSAGVHAIRVHLLLTFILLLSSVNCLFHCHIHVLCKQDRHPFNSLLSRII